MAVREYRIKWHRNTCTIETPSIDVMRRAVMKLGQGYDHCPPCKKGLPDEAVDEQRKAKEAKA